jgi:hypothetical protein
VWDRDRVITIADSYSNIQCEWHSHTDVHCFAHDDSIANRDSIIIMYSNELTYHDRYCERYTIVRHITHAYTVAKCNSFIIVDVSAWLEPLHEWRLRAEWLMPAGVRLNVWELDRRQCGLPSRLTHADCSIFFED